VTSKLVLASASPRRVVLLAQLGITPDEVRPADIDETPREDEQPRLYALRMARAKADAIARPGEFTLAADTVVSCGRRILGKPETAETARACLALLSGRRHRIAAHMDFLAGSPSGVIGLPLHETTQLLRGLGFPLP
jgi:septum formation protein